jgi:hypothetical protein
MSLGLRLSLLPLLIAGCASQLVTVPESDWQTVPAPQREAVDRQLAADVTAANTELTAAKAGLAAMQRSQPAPAAAPRTAPRTPVAAKRAAGGDEWANTLHAQEQARIDAAAQVESAKAAWQRADLAWRQRRVDAAKARFAVLECERELVHAQTIEHNLPGTDTYDIAPLRGQFSQAQQRWYGVANKARQARAALEQASASLSTAKEAYAQVMRGGPRPAATQPSLAAAPPPLELPGWALPRSELRRRRGLRHFLDAGTSPQLRGMAIQLKVTSRTPQAIALGMTPLEADSPTTNGKPVIEAPQSNAPPAAAKPAATPPPSAPAVAAKPAATPPPSAPTVAAKPAATPPPSAPAVAAKPADGPLFPTSATAGPSVNPKPAAVAPASKPPAAAAKPADAPLFPTSAAAGPAVNPKPAAAPQPSAPTAAKPAERPVSQTDTPKR